MKKFILPILLLVMFIPFCVKAKSHLEVGDYIYMVPDLDTYTIAKEKTGSRYDQTITPKELTLWRVISKNDDGTFDAISEYVSHNGINFRGADAYKYFVNTLQEIASAYKKEGYTKSTREMGYDGQTLIIDNTSAFDGSTNVAPSSSSTINPTVGTGEEYQDGVLGDTLYLKDYNLVSNVYKSEPETYGINGLIAYDKNTGYKESYWVASRSFEYNTPSNYIFHGREVPGYNSEKLSNGFLREYSYGWYDHSCGIGVRPIITLEKDIKIETGEGTKSIPFKLRKRGNGNILVQNDNIKGRVEIDKQENIDEDENVSFSIKKEKGYKLSNIIIKDQNGTIIDYYYNGSNYSFVMPDNDVTITPIYEKVKSSVNVEIMNETDDITVSIDDMSQVEYEEEVNFKVTPIKGYKVSDVIIVDIDGNEIEYNTTDTDKKNYTFTMPASDVTIIPSYERVSNSVSVDDNKNTKKFIIEVNDSKAVVYEDTVKFIITPEDGYEIENIEIRDENNNTVEYKKTNNNNNEYVFTMPDTDVTIKPIYRKIESINVPDTLKNPNTRTDICIVLSIIALIVSTSFYLIIKKDYFLK